MRYEPRAQWSEIRRPEFKYERLKKQTHMNPTRRLMLWCVVLGTVAWGVIFAAAYILPFVHWFMG